MKRSLLTIGLVAGLYMGAEAQHPDAGRYARQQAATQDTTEQAIDTSMFIEKDGVELYKAKTGINVTLLGVDDVPFEFYKGNGVKLTLHTKGLLFRMEDGDLLRLLGNSGGYYPGQKYDINYHLFKEDQEVGPEFVRDYFTNNDSDPTMIYTPINSGTTGEGSQFEGMLRYCTFRERD